MKSYNIVGYKFIKTKKGEQFYVLSVVKPAYNDKDGFEVFSSFIPIDNKKVIDALDGFGDYEMYFDDAKRVVAIVKI